MQPMQKNAGTPGTVGTACIHAAFRVPGNGDSAGTRGDKTGGGQRAIICDFNLSPRVPAAFFSGGTLETLVLQGVPMCPRCPREKQDGSQ